jgi:hypothetical protein
MKRFSGSPLRKKEGDSTVGNIVFIRHLEDKIQGKPLGKNNQIGRRK